MTKFLFACLLLGVLGLTSCEYVRQEILDQLEPLCPNYKDLLPDIQDIQDKLYDRLVNQVHNDSRAAICSVIRKGTAISKEIVDVINKCDNEEIEEVVEAGHKILDASEEYLCGGGVIWLEGMLADNSTTCLDEMKDSMLNSSTCDHVQEMDNFLHGSRFEICHFFHDFYLCVLESFKDCTKSYYKEFIEGFYRSIANAACPKFTFGNSAFGHVPCPAMVAVALFLLQLFSLLKS